MKRVIIKVMSRKGLPDGASLIRPTEKQFCRPGKRSATRQEGCLLPGKGLIKCRILPNHVKYLRRQPGWVTTFRLPAFYRINARAKRLRHLTLRDIELLSDCANICNFIASYSGNCFPSAMDLNSLFKRRFQFIIDAHSIPRNNMKEYIVHLKLKI